MAAVASQVDGSVLAYNGSDRAVPLISINANVPFMRTRRANRVQLTAAHEIDRAVSPDSRSAYVIAGVRDAKAPLLRAVLVDGVKGRPCSKVNRSVAADSHRTNSR